MREKKGGIPLSKIIKGFEQPSLSHYDFRILSDEAGEKRKAFHPGEDGFSPWHDVASGGPDPSSVLDDLEETIQNRLLELERRAQEIEEEAYTKGYAQGERDGYAVGEKRVQIVTERVKKLFTTLENLPQRVFADYRRWLVSTSIAIARKIVGSELSINPEAVSLLVKEILDDVEPHHSLTLYMHPKDMEILAKGMDLARWNGDGQRSFLLKGDSGLERGGCRMESDLQSIDASLETRFAQLEQLLDEDGSTRDA